MGRYKPVESGLKFLPVDVSQQLLPGTLEHALSLLIGEEVDLNALHARVKNDQSGAPAYSPKVLLKIVLFANSRGVISSLQIAQVCLENVVFISLSSDSAPNHCASIRPRIAMRTRPVLSDEVRRRTLRLRKEAKALRQWLQDNPQDRTGPNGAIRKSNRTDNASAKMATSHGVIQGYTGVAAVDVKHEIIVQVNARGTGSEQELLPPMVEAFHDLIGSDSVLSADYGYHSEANLAGLAQRNIQALIADKNMRQRDPRFAPQTRHKTKPDRLWNKEVAPVAKSITASSMWFVMDLCG